MTKTRLYRAALIAAFIPTVLVIGAANAITIATFADPTIGGPVTPMFYVQNTGPGVGAVVGGWAAPGLDLQVASTTYTDAKLSFGALGYTGTFSNGTLGAGAFDFYDSSNTLVFKVQFDGAMVNIGGLAGDNIFSNNNVQFSGPVVASLGTLSNQSFAFSFTNQAPIMGAAGPVGFTSTAAFTSSATPEPATALAMVLGSVFVVMRRRRK